MTDTTPTTPVDEEPPAPDPPPPTVPDGWEFSTNRVATLWVDGVAHRLKPPTVGELRSITERMEAADETLAASRSAMLDQLDGLRSRLEDLRARADADEEDAAAALKEALADLEELNRRLGKELTALVGGEWWAVVEEVFATLGTRRLPALDGLPAWVPATAAEQVGELLVFWRSLPPRRGVRP